MSVLARKGVVLLPQVMLARRFLMHRELLARRCLVSWIPPFAVAVVAYGSVIR